MTAAPGTAVASPPNPTEFCMCGCGRTAPIAKKSRHARGIIAGERQRYCRGHNPVGDAVPCDEETLTVCPTCERPMHPGGDRRCEKGHHPGSLACCRPCGRGSSKTTRRLGPEPAVATAKLLQEWDHFHGLLGYNTKRFADAVKMSPDAIRKALATWAETRPQDPRPAEFERTWERDHPPQVSWHNS